MPMQLVFINCALELHVDRGVLYVHNQETGASLLRIQGLSPEGLRSFLTQKLPFLDIRLEGHDLASVAQAQAPKGQDEEAARPRALPQEPRG